MASDEKNKPVLYIVDSNADYEVPQDQLWPEIQWKTVLAEFIATAFLVLFGCMSCIPVEGLTQQGLILGSVGFGLTVMFNIQIFGPISGAHMNPAVTLSAVIWGSTSIVTGLAYFVAQCVGSIAGYGILILLTTRNVAMNGICVTLPTPHINEFQVLGLEIFLTSVLVLVCCSVWDPVNQDKQDSSSIKFGLVVTVLSIIGGPWTSAAMNPARSLGPAIWTGVWTMHWVYWVGPFLGSLIATLFYKIVWCKKVKSIIA